MVRELKEKIKKGAKIGAAVGFGLGVVLSAALKPDDMGNLEFMLRASGVTVGSTAISSLGGAAISTIVHYKYKTLDYIHKRFSGDYVNSVYH
ncbi:MAG: hypothetical protein Q8N63_06330 [Nanoarchaeota archaeon]|nr:hypothetical protein [Nanoarchaeota archaeon]